MEKIIPKRQHRAGREESETGRIQGLCHEIVSNLRLFVDLIGNLFKQHWPPDNEIAENFTQFMNDLKQTEREWFAAASRFLICPFPASTVVIISRCLCSFLAVLNFHPSILVDARSAVAEARTEAVTD